MQRWNYLQFQQSFLLFLKKYNNIHFDFCCEIFRLGNAGICVP